MQDYDVRDYSNSVFVKKDDLRRNGPKVAMVQSVEEVPGLAKRDGRQTKELVLVFPDGSKFALRAKANRDAMSDAYGFRASGWIGKVIELYCDPTVTNPFNSSDQGGVRLRVPGAATATATATAAAAFVSDLEPASAPAAKPNGSGGAPEVAPATAVPFLSQNP